MQKYFQSTINSHLPRKTLEKKKLDFMGIVLMKATPLPHIYTIIFGCGNWAVQLKKMWKSTPPNLVMKSNSNDSN